MTVSVGKPSFVEFFLRAETDRLRHCLKHRETTLIWLCVAVIIFGAGLYGAVMGCWRSALQSVYTAIKLPLVVLLTTAGNGLLNGMLAPLLGLRVGFRRSSVIVLMSFAI